MQVLSNKANDLIQPKGIGLRGKNAHVIVRKVQKCPRKIFWGKTAHQISKVGQKCPSPLTSTNFR